MNPRASTPAIRSTGHNAVANPASAPIAAAKAGAVGEQRHDVLEEDPGLWEVRYVAQPGGYEAGDIWAGVALGLQSLRQRRRGRFCGRAPGLGAGAAPVPTRRVAAVATTRSPSVSAAPDLARLARSLARLAATRRVSAW